MGFLSALVNFQFALRVPGITGAITPPPNVPTGGLFTTGQDVIRVGITFFLIIVFLLAIFYLLIGALRYVYSRGDKQKIQGAREKITFSIVGLTIAFLAFAIMTIISQFFNVNLLSFPSPGIAPTPPSGNPCPPPTNLVCSQFNDNTLRGDWTNNVPGNYRLEACVGGAPPWDELDCFPGDLTSGNFGFARNLFPGVWTLYVNVESNAVGCNPPSLWSNPSTCSIVIGTPTPTPSCIGIDGDCSGGSVICCAGLGLFCGNDFICHPLSTSMPIPTNTPVPSSTPAPISTPGPTSTPMNTPTPTNTPTPSPTPTPISCFPLIDKDRLGYEETCIDRLGTHTDYCSGGFVKHFYTCNAVTQLCEDNLDTDCSIFGQVCVVELNGAPVCKFATLTVNGFVWIDNDKDGIRDAGEPGFVGAEIRALKFSDRSLAGTTTVNDIASAYFEFKALNVGEYIISLTLPAGYAMSPNSNSGSNEAYVDITNFPANVYNIYGAFGIVPL